MKTIVICSSAAFYEHANQLKAKLEAAGFKVIVPATAVQMEKDGNYDVDAVKTWYKDSAHFHIKTMKMRDHFDEVAAGDAILVVNDKKRDIEGYIGPNCLMEMGLAFYLHKPIYVLNKIGKDMPFYEEVLGMDSVIIDGNLGKVK